MSEKRRVLSQASEPPHPNPLPSGERELQASLSLATASVVAPLPTHTNPAACIAAPRAPARRYCAAWPRGCPAAPATAADAARDRARGAGIEPRRRRSGAAGGMPCANRSATRRTRRNSGAAATPFRPRGGARVLDGAQLRLGFHARLEHRGQHGKVLVVLWFGAFHGQTLPSRGAFLRPRFLVRTIANGSHACKNVVTSIAKPVRL